VRVALSWNHAVRLLLISLALLGMASQSQAGRAFCTHHTFGRLPTFEVCEGPNSMCQSSLATSPGSRRTCRKSGDGRRFEAT
jgi:hypothetical protein